MDLHIPSLGATARYPGYVAWCRKVESGYRVGISFTDEHALFGGREWVSKHAGWNATAASTKMPSQPPRKSKPLAREWVSRHAGEFSHEAFVRPALD